MLNARSIIQKAKGNPDSMKQPDDAGQLKSQP